MGQNDPFCLMAKVAPRVYNTPCSRDIGKMRQSGLQRGRRNDCSQNCGGRLPLQMMASSTKNEKWCIQKLSRGRCCQVNQAAY